jgi:tagatose-6-phosphate ketose/aldose isomerase
MDMFGLSSAQLESSGARWTAREILQQPQIWSEIARLVADEAAGLSAFLKPLYASC